MRCIKIDLGNERRDIVIYPFFDVHLGSPKCDTKRLLADIEKVKSNPDAYAILGGDLINNSTKGSVGDVYTEALTPMQQIQTAIRIFEPIKDKIIGVCSGNHEARSYKTDGIDLTYFLATELGIADRYDSTSCLLFIRFGKSSARSGSSHCNSNKICYTLYFSHGTGQGGKMVGSKANGLQKRAEIVPDADIVVTGHTHAPITFKEAHYQISYQNSSVSVKETTFVNVTSYVLHEEYAETIGLKPSSDSNPLIVLCGDKKKVRVHL